MNNRLHSINIEFFCLLFMLYNLLAFNEVFFIKIYEKCGLLFTAATFAVLWALGSAICLIIFYKKTIKPLCFVFLPINAAAFYFVKNYNVFIDSEMLQNVLQTNYNETSDLLNIKFVFYIALLAFLPSLIIARLNFCEKHFWRYRLLSFLTLISICLAIIIPNTATVVPFVRQHKPLKYQLIPVNYISAISSSIKRFYRQNRKFQTIADDASFTKYWLNKKNNLFILVVGETARADKFSFNGYKRHTNAPLEKYRNNIINYTNAMSCGTSTAVSLPCMFAKDSRTEFKSGSMAYTENLLDILHKNGYNVVWVENNSDCKSLCYRIKTLYPCGIHPQERECNDSILLPQITEAMPQTLQNTFIVLHQIGSHGPKYYKRYPQEFNRYKPTCNTENLNKCTSDELTNVYDNTIYYTSYILAKIIKDIKKYQNDYNIVLIYVSDHGESLGENGLYLHSAPYSFAPVEQKHIPFFMWAEDQTWEALKIDKECLQKNSHLAVSHDFIFHSMLDFTGISTTEYNPDYDILLKCKK